METYLKLFNNFIYAQSVNEAVMGLKRGTGLFLQRLVSARTPTRKLLMVDLKWALSLVKGFEA